MAGYESAVVRIVTSAGRSTAGLGLLVGTREVITCAHVVNTALGHADQLQQARPADSSLVHVEFPLLPGPPVRTARVVAWMPPRQAGAGDGDVAGLVLNEDAPPAAVPGRFSTAAIVPGTGLRVFGYPGIPPRQTGAWVDVDVKGQVGGQLIQVESRNDQTIKAQPGYSGSPVWLDGAGTAVGLLQATAFADEPFRDAYLLSAGMVADSWAEQFDYLLVPDNPYRGLEPFTAEHAAVFFGRDEDIDTLTARVIEQQVVVVVGPSGVGKSSLVQAGLLPRLQHQGSWTVALIRPGQDPWHRIASSLLRAMRPRDAPATAEESLAAVEEEIARLRAEGFGATARFLRSEGRHLLVVVDQFEELVAAAQPPDAELLDLLLPSAEDADAATRLVHTLRADFLPALLAVPGTAARLDRRMFPLSPLKDEQVRDAVEQPAAQRGVSFQEGLVDQIVRDTTAGSLPLLEFTLTRLWRTQRHRTLDFTGYQSMGGVSGALDQFAEQQVAALPSDTADVIDSVLLRLVRTVGDNELVTRQRVYQSLVPAAPWQALRHLADARLVIVDSDPVHGAYAELAHETLTTSWQRLRRLVQQNTDFLRWLDAISRRAAEEDPLPDARIAEARRWLDIRPTDISDQVKAFVERSQTAAESRIRAARRSNKRLRRLLVGVAALLVIAVVAGALAVNQTQQARTQTRIAEEQRRIAQSGELALSAAALPEERLDQALLLSQEAFLLQRSARTLNSVLSTLRSNPAVVRILQPGVPVLSLAATADGRFLASGGQDGTVRVWEVATGQEIGPVRQLEGEVRHVEFHPNGQEVAAAGSSGVVRQWSVDSGAEVAPAFHGHRGSVRSIAYAPDGQNMATGGEDQIILLWNADTGEVRQRFVGHRDWINAVIFAGDSLITAGGRTEGLSTDHRIILWNTATGAVTSELTGHSDAVRALSVSSDGAYLASAGADANVLVWNLATQQLVQTLTGNDERVLDVAFSANNTQWVASAGRDQTVRVWDVSTGLPVTEPLLGHGRAVRGVNFVGGYLASAGNDGRILVWDAADPHRSRLMSRLAQQPEAVRAVATSRDGMILATASIDGQVVVRRSDDGSEQGRLVAAGAVTGMAFSPDGKGLLTATNDGILEVWDVAGLQRLAGPVITDDESAVVAWSNQAGILASAGSKGVVRIWDSSLNSLGAPLRGSDNWIIALEFRFDDALLAVGADGVARLWTTYEGDAAPQNINRPIGRITAGLLGVDGEEILTGDIDGDVVFWSGTEVEQDRVGQREVNTGNGDVTALAVSADAQWLVVGDASGALHLWDVSGPTPEDLGSLGKLLGPVRSLAFALDGKRIVSGDDFGAQLWIVDVSTWLRTACEVAGRNLSASEQSDYLGVQGRRTCRTLPEYNASTTRGELDED